MTTRTTLQNPTYPRFGRYECEITGAFDAEFRAASASTCSASEDSRPAVSEYMRSRQRAYYATVRDRAKNPLKPNADISIPFLRSLAATAVLVMPFESTVDLSPTADAATNVQPLPTLKKAETPREIPDEVDSRDWRGVVSVNYQDAVLFTKRIEITPGSLREWEPEVVIDGPRFRDEDA